MSVPPKPANRYGSFTRGVSAADVDCAADQLLRNGQRPTVEKIRASLGSGSPNTINPLLDSWWKRLSNRLDAGPQALHRLPEVVAHIAESLWMQALEEARRRALIELSSDKRAVEQAKDGYEVRSHVLSLREGEMDSRLRERERAYTELEAQLRTVTTMLRKEQKTRDLQSTSIANLQAELEGLRVTTKLRPRIVQKRRGGHRVKNVRAEKPSTSTKVSAKRAKSTRRRGGR